MSEPVIKPSYWVCEKCETAFARRMKLHIDQGGIDCDGEIYPHFELASVKRAVEEACRIHGSIIPKRASEIIVDRLTKGET